MKKFVSLCVYVALLCIGIIDISFAQTRSNDLVQVLVSPDNAEWNYPIGKDAVFSIRVLKHQVPLTDIEVSYTIGPEKMKPLVQGTVKLKNGVAIVKGKLNEPGFLRCEVKVMLDGVNYRGIATAGYTVEAIQPTQKLPGDFIEFWSAAKVEAAKIPLDAKTTLLPDLCTEKVDVYEVNIQNYETGSRLYGILARPKKDGRYPAVLQVPGAGIRPYKGIIHLAEQGIITLQIGIHGIPVTLPQVVYDNLRAGALKGYNNFNLDNRDKYYYKRVYLGCLRAVDYIHSLDIFNGTDLLVWGGSQGGALAIVTAALDDRVKGLVSLYPALCDLTGYLHGRAGGWPHMFNEAGYLVTAKDEKIKASAYYDVVNFARFVKVPGFYTWGYNDEVCPPTSFYSAYNLIKAPREILVIPQTGHWTFTEQQIAIENWILRKLKG